ncbi:TIGR02234 family membrane protein [Williamsia sp. CHRR-6]|uniref:TIGR02234 family membrane protein n=1 Tax=Williamsia sp. CHRR-6 TaxID=2835871 RepID=UPI001BDAEF2A|nr:TIGR02234 family membrane protein [Williamsia sp. CHRR-6]MBT0565206.1 TIGR02234 family membrane protein [Williamsia sp. CHRR-6]
MTSAGSDPGSDPTPRSGHSAKSSGSPDPTLPASARRRRLTVASVLLALAAAAMWSSSRLPWAKLVAADGMSPPREFTVHGADWSPVLTPLAIVVVAAIAAAVAVRGWALALVAVIVAIVAVVGAIPAVSLLTESNAVTYASKAVDLPSLYRPLSVETHKAVSLLVLLASALAVAAAVVLLRAARGAGALSTRYQSPAARRAELEEKVFAERARAATGENSPRAADTGTHGADPELTERMLWDALDSGDDPTSPGATSGPSDQER